MIAIVYRSVATHSFTEEELIHLSKAATIRNVILDVTGYLYHRDSQFLQYLEGPEDNLFGLFQLICDDPRHHVTEHFVIEDRTNRLFPSWYMEYINPDLVGAESKRIEAELAGLLLDEKEKTLTSEHFAAALDAISHRLATLYLD